MYTGGALFMDICSKQVENVFQQHLSTHETVKANEDFELKCKDAGVVTLQYISDNGSAFTSKSYSAHLSNFSQLQHFAELEHIATMELQRRPSRPSCLMQAP